jgi:MoaA/NifB/PqqE/SkfB family radical SAM enzyme
VPLFLQPDVQLDAAGDMLRLSRLGERPLHALALGEAVALTLLGAVGDADRAASLAADVMPGGEGRAWVRRVVDRFWTYLGDGPPRPPALEWLGPLPRRRPRLPMLPASSLRREAAPSAVSWMVTLACNRRCPYCFFAVTHHAAEEPGSPPDATFPQPAAVRMVREMGRIGAADLYLTGGEPLLRRDLPEIVAAASEARVRAHLVTKYAVDRALAERLAGARLAEATFSLDDARPNQAAALAGAPGFLDQASAAVTALLEAGVPLEVNAVATAVNAEHLDALARWAIERGVPRLSVSPMSAPYPSRPPATRLLTRVDVPALVARLRDAHGARIAIEAGSAATPEGGHACSQVAVCEVGSRSLDVLPDGRVTRCRYLHGHDELVVGSLPEQTLLDLWEGGTLAAVHRPAPRAYEGTACSGCGGFDACHSRGRCFVSSLSETGRLHAPDAFCTAGAP